MEFSDNSERQFQFEISLSVLNHLGRNLYRNFITVLGEAISNAWDAEAKNVWIDIDRENSSFSIKDDGSGMNDDDFQNKFLKIGYSKRKEDTKSPELKRPYIGAKGIGKLALLSCAERISIFTKTKETSYTGGVIDNSDLDVAIKHDLKADDYPLEQLDFSQIEELKKDHEKGTIIHFANTKEHLKNSDAFLKKLMALSFKFSLFDKEFNIHVNGKTVTVDDLKSLADTTQFIWNVNQYSDEFIKSCANLKANEIQVTTPLDIKGFVASVEKPRHLKITNTDQRVTIDLFVNGRLREKNILRHIPTQRIVESYIYGQIHFDSMDRVGEDPFTTSREGILEGDALFEELMDYLKNTLVPQILDEWDDLRLRVGDEGDDENKRKSKKERKARDLYSETKKDYQSDDPGHDSDKVEEWLRELQSDAEFNFTSYADCFLSENLIRKYIKQKNIPYKPGVQKEAEDWKEKEESNKTAANLSFEIRLQKDDVYYLGMDALAVTAEGERKSTGQSLWLDAIRYKPVRNAIGHTGLLTPTAKSHLNTTFENIRARIKVMLKDVN